MNNRSIKSRLAISFLVMTIALSGIVHAEYYNLVFWSDKNTGCGEDNFFIGMASDELLSIGNLHLESDVLDIKKYGNSFNFFVPENIFRKDREHIEFFDISPEHYSGYIGITFGNKSNPTSRLKPGTYDFRFIPEFRRSDDSYIIGNPLPGTITVENKFDVVDISASGRKKVPNSIIMGENISIAFSGTITYPDTKNIEAQVYYHGKGYDKKNLNATGEIDQKFNETLGSITENLQENIICPRENITIEFSGICSEKELSIKQVPPEPSDIYYNVGKYFETRENYRIKQIYYMVGAYFNCRRADALAY